MRRGGAKPINKKGDAPSAHGCGASGSGQKWKGGGRSTTNEEIGRQTGISRSRKCGGEEKGREGREKINRQNSSRRGPRFVE